MVMMETFKDKITSLDSDVKKTSNELSEVVKNIVVMHRDIEGSKGVKNDVDAVKWMLMNVSHSLTQQMLSYQSKTMDVIKSLQEENKRLAVRLASLENRMEKVNETMEKVSAETITQSNTVKELSGEVAAVRGELNEAPPAPERVQHLQTDLTELQMSFQKSNATLQAQMENLMLQVRMLQTRINDRV
ncbi:hypothetical protein CHS0354_017646 [Potamilus streckersoni]|nr:hypothetical protein CHS0354_017646 [Potamilus streckersoni]